MMTNEPGEHMCTDTTPPLFSALQAHTGSPPHVEFNKQTFLASAPNEAFPRERERAVCQHVAAIGGLALQQRGNGCYIHAPLLGPGGGG